MNTSEKVLRMLNLQGRKKKWLADKLNLSRPTLDKRLANNDWSIGQIMQLKQLLGIS